MSARSVQPRSLVEVPEPLGEGLEMVSEEVAQRPSRRTPAPDDGEHLTGSRGSGLAALAPRPAQDGWTPVCRLEQIDPESGVAALVDGRAVAVFRTHDDTVHALDNYDPFSRASVLARGIVGTRTVEGDPVPYVASPMFKQGFDLRTGQCLDDAAVRVAAYDVRLVPGPDGPVVEVGSTRE